ncbi:hypothetical protein ACFUV1_08375 [Streptomyces griseoincarnatus]
MFSRWWLGARQRHGNTWAQRIIWVLERLDASESSSLDRWGSLCSVVPDDDPVARFDMARQLLPSIFDVRLPGARRRAERSRRAPVRRSRSRRVLLWTASTLSVIIIATFLAGYLYIADLQSGLSSTQTQSEKAKIIAERLGKDGPLTADDQKIVERLTKGDTLMSADQLVSGLEQLGLYALIALGVLVWVFILVFMGWAWVGSGRAVKRLERGESP